MPFLTPHIAWRADAPRHAGCEPGPTRATYAKTASHAIPWIRNKIDEVFKQITKPPHSIKEVFFDCGSQGELVAYFIAHPAASIFFPLSIDGLTGIFTTGAKRVIRCALTVIEAKGFRRAGR
jgi:hypothetical protein